MTKLEVKSLDDLPEAARKFINYIGQHTVIAFYGKMGAGKTTFIKAVCKELGVTDRVTSPTFALINEYTAMPAGQPVFHFDFYRIKDISEVYDLGYEDYFYSNNFCLVEWPEMIESILPEETLKVTITVNDDESRVISF
ncbi:MAG: tRNA (adenosine(37)-N6)-threonylcarbamoyltransferase complex ATPase subunit type 1 TsaE [Bacteroidota bacterium]